MKRSSMFILMIVVVAVHRTAQNSVCNTSNPFLDKLQKSSIAILPTPVKDVQFCQPEWSDHLRCCNPETLKSWVKADAARIRAAVEKVKAVMSRYGSIFNSLAVGASQIQAKNLTFGNPNRRAFLETILHPDTDKKIKKLQNVDVNQHLESCWNQMLVIRANSICSFCSGRWQLYFENAGEKKAWITDDTCKLVTGSCQLSYDGLVEFIELVDKINKALLNAFLDDNLNAPNLVEFFRTAKAWADEIQKKHIPKLTKSNEQSQQRELCELTLQVMGHTLIEKVAQKFDNAQFDRLESFNKNLELKIQTGTLGSRLRLLQSEMNSNFGIIDPLFIGDVKVMANIDSSYTSHLGAIGASRNENSAHLNALPLNITSAFL